MTKRLVRRQGRSPLETEVLLLEDLRVLSGLHHVAGIERWARSQNIRYRHDGQGGIWTTVTALNVALGIVHVVVDDDDPIEIA